MCPYGWNCDNNAKHWELNRILLLSLAEYSTNSNSIALPAVLHFYLLETNTLDLCSITLSL